MLILNVKKTKNDDGILAKSSIETAETLAYFKSTYTEELLGPLTRQYYREFNGNNIYHLIIYESDAKDALLKLDISL